MIPIRRILAARRKNKPRRPQSLQRPAGAVAIGEVLRLRKVKANLNPRIEIEALVRTMYDPRSSLTNQVSDEIKSHFGDKVFDTVIPRNIRIAEAPSFGKPVILHDPASKGALAHFAFARELLGRQGIPIKEAA